MKKEVKKELNKDEVAKILDDHKAFDIKIYEVGDLTPFASYYVVATVLNIRALGALADIVEEEFEKNGMVVVGKDGTPESGWIVISGDDITVQLFLDYQREEYALDDFIEKQKSFLEARKA